MNPGELYTRLGLQPDATPPQIRRAYRRAAKTAHPDAGGSPAQWAAILEAYETLMDERRRRIYDETGEVEPGAVDNHYAALLMIITGAMDEIAAQSGQSAPPFDQIDWVGSLRALLRTKIQQIRQGIGPLGRRAEEWDAVAKRITVPAGEVNALRGLAEGKAGECRRRTGEGEQAAQKHEEALKLIENATCAPGERLTMPQVMARGLGQAYLGRMW
jgi:curved DNA-binding protein CbpA